MRRQWGRPSGRPALLAVLFLFAPLAHSLAQRAPARDTMSMPVAMPGAMSMAPDPLGIPMDRAGSGTTWIPDAVSLPSRHFMAGGWDMMLHGFAFGQYNKQGGPRGQSQAGSLNWA